MVKTILAAVLLINLVSFTVYGIDKHKARKSKWRIPESTLLLLALAAPFGAALGMRTFHHKTHHKKFTILVPLFLVLHILLGLLAAFYLFIP